ncbi:TonB-dependent receptor [Sphingobium nicotianae]|uniref:TonB-dependent receptor n=1 Tax=Sphingobium nicotianae TaxID=2782607 RepID=A0A9X1D9X1_9SPHN|nr:TonB-dependent receptor [Sphingobium nicotianae]MBT2186035.1 TonB-dependent receptor [Sphingobium nicotianae]
MIEVGRGSAARRMSVRLLSTTLLSLWSLPVLAQMGAPAADAPEEQASSEGAPGGDIVVTAQRRAQSVLSVPYNISAVDGDTLRRSGSLSLNDLARAVPGVVTVDGGLGSRGNKNNMTLRGLRTDAVEPGGGQGGAGLATSQVATYFGETQFTFPLMLADIERVEVLRGPQGTLYGASSQAGTIRFVPNRPKFDAFSGYVNVGGSLTEHSSDPSFNLEGALNLPMAPNLALRVVGGYVRAGGFIDAVNHIEVAGDPFTTAPTRRIPSDPRSGVILKPVERDTNRADQWMARGELRYQPVDALDIQLNYLHQETTARDQQVSQPDYPGGTFAVGIGAAGYNPAAFPNGSYTARPGGPYESTSFYNRPFENNVDLVSLDVTVDVGLASITSATSYVDTRTATGADTLGPFITPQFNYTNYYGYFPRMMPYAKSSTHYRIFTQEVRLVSSWDKPINYTIGGYYQREKFDWAFRMNIPGYNQYLIDIGSPPVGTDQNDNIDRATVFVDRAVFGELTYNLTKAWQVTGGIRFFWQDFDTTQTTAFPQSNFLRTDVGNSVKNDRVVKINTSYDVTPTVKLYATYSEGFRRGGATGIPLSGVYASLPKYATFQPDVATNYEVGVKGTLFNRALRFSADLFLIDLENFQFQTSTPTGNFTVVNGSRARSKGLEFESSLRLSRSLDVAFAYNFTDAKVAETFTISDLAPGALFSTQPLVTSTFLAGKALPGVPRHTFSAALDYTIPLDNGANVAVHADGLYRSSAPAGLNSTRIEWTRQQDAFLGNVRLTYDSARSWAIDLFVNNITNTLGSTGGYIVRKSQQPLVGTIPMRPRSFGFLARYKF